MLSTLSLHIGHIPKTRNDDTFTKPRQKFSSKALPKIEGKVIFVIKTPEYFTEDDEKSLAKLDDPKHLLLFAGCTAHDK